MDKNKKTGLILILFACCLLLVCGVLSEHIELRGSILFRISKMKFLGFPYKYIVAFCIVIISVGIGSYLNLFDIAAFIRRNKRLTLYSILFTLFILIPFSIQIYLAYEEKQSETKMPLDKEYRSKVLDFIGQRRGYQLQPWEDVLAGFNGKLDDATFSKLMADYINLGTPHLKTPQQKHQWIEDYILQPTREYYKQNPPVQNGERPLNKK